MAKGTFVLADIGGYSRFLQDVGIEHAKEITSHLFNGLFEVDPDTWQVGNVEGDCLFLYSDSEMTAEGVYRYLRGLYEKFRDSIAEVAAGSTCRCGACDRSGDLTIKFVVHEGEFDVHEIVGRRELIGPDVVLAHRLLKNSVPVREYAIVTAPLAAVADVSGLKPRPGSDEYAALGAVEYRYLDFQPVRDEIAKSHEIYLTEQDADVAVPIEIDAPPDLVWRILMDEENTRKWSPTLIEFETLSGVADEVGSVHTCLHGDIGKTVHLRVGIDNENRRLTDRLFGVPLVGQMIQTFLVEPFGAGSRFVLCYAIKPGADADEESKSFVLQAAHERSLRDVLGMKEACETAVRET